MKSTDRILAQRYARAFDGLSKDGAEASARYDVLCAAAAVLATAQAYMNDPAIASAEKKSLVQKALHAAPETAAFISTLIEAKRYYLLDACVEQVGELLDARLGVVRAKVQTAFELSDEQKKRVEEVLGRFAGGKKAEAVYQVEPDLLGGLRVQMGDVLIDGSLKRQFEKLKEEIMK